MYMGLNRFERTHQNCSWQWMRVDVSCANISLTEFDLHGIAWHSIRLRHSIRFAYYGLLSLHISTQLPTITHSHAFEKFLRVLNGFEHNTTSYFPIFPNISNKIG